MAGRLDEFWSRLTSDGIAKNSHWDAQINIPLSLLGTEFSGIGQMLKFRCEAGELPGRQLVTNDVKIYGPIYRTPYQSLYTELNLTFLETEDMMVRRFMEAWMNTIFNSEDNVLQYQNTYQTGIQLTQYHVVPRPVAPPTESGSRIVSEALPSPPPGLAPSLYMNLYRAYPININQMTTAWSDDSAHRVQVTFFYEWYSMSVAAQPTSGRSKTAPEPAQTVVAPVGLYDTATAWFSQITRKAP